MDSTKLTVLCSRLLDYELNPFIIGVSSGQITPKKSSSRWGELKNKAQNNQLAPEELRELAQICNYERLTLVFELIDEMN